ncbi:hypothetical protein F4803DRAFT_512796 [Xylaria telfairii]|nr:hypothetical protein F4803DRAFT_512796 [Xylaria telfairii]
MNPQIQEWQKTILPNQGSDEVISIAKVFSNCSDLWGVITRVLTQQHCVQKDTIRKLESAHGYIRLWADGYGVLGGQFEERLKNSQRAGDLTIRLLQNICRTLKELTSVVAGISTFASQDATDLSLTAADLALSAERLVVLVHGDNDSEVSDDGESGIPPWAVSREKLLNDIADDLRNDAQCLLDLGARFEEQVINPIISEAAASPLNSVNGGLSDIFIERIIRLYPQCESNLAGRMGKANWLRFLSIAEVKPQTIEGRGIQDRDTNIIHDATGSEPIERRSIVDITSTREKSLFRDSGLGTASHVSGSHPNAPPSSLIPSFSKTDANNEVVCPLLNQDGSSCRKRCIGEKRYRSMQEHIRRAHPEHYISKLPPTEESFLLMINTPLADRRQAQVSVGTPQSSVDLIRATPKTQGYPQLPDGAVQGKPFRCITCKNQVTMASEKEWRVHLLRDIQPYVCPEPDCDAPLFAEASQWEKHVANRHPQSAIWSDSRCRICGEATGNRAIVLEHLVDHMEAIALAIIPRGSGIEADKALANDTYDESEEMASGSKLEYKKTSQTALSRVKTACNTCRRLRVKCDGKKPSCGNCVRRMIVCVRDSGTDSKSVKPPSPPHQTDNSKFENAALRDPLQQWYPRFAGTAAASVLDDDHFLDNGPSPPVKFQEQRLDNIFSKPPRSRDKPLPPIIVDDPDDMNAMKRARNTLAARKSRERKFQRLEELEEKIAKLEQERDNWKNIVMKHQAGKS